MHTLFGGKKMKPTEKQIKELLYVTAVINGNRSEWFEQRKNRIPNFIEMEIILASANALNIDWENRISYRSVMSDIGRILNETKM